MSIWPFQFASPGALHHENGVYTTPPGLVWQDGDWQNATENYEVLINNGALEWDAYYQTADMEYEYGLHDDSPGGVFGNVDSYMQANGDAEHSLKSYSGGQSYYCYESGASGKTMFKKNIAAHQLDEPVGFTYYETSSNTNTVMELADGAGNKVMDVGTNNPQVTWYNGSLSGELYDPADYEQWRRITLDNWDWAAGTVDFTWEDLTGSNATQSTTLDLGSTQDVATVSFTHSAVGPWGGSGILVYLDDIIGPWDGPYPASLTTASKTADSPMKPSVSLDYTTGDGRVLLDVIGSPGTANEERATVYADGNQTTFDLSPYFATGHETFAVRPQLDGSTDYATNPTVNRVELSGGSDPRDETVIEDFELTRTLSAFTMDDEHDRHAGAPYTGLSSDVVYEGQTALNIDLPVFDRERYARLVSFPGDGLRNYPTSNGNVFRAFVRVETHPDSTPKQYADLLFGMEDTAHGYAVRFTPGDASTTGSGELNITTVSYGNYTQLATASGDWQDNVWYQIEVEWTSDNTITARLLNTSGSELASCSVTDSTYAGVRGFGFGAQSSNLGTSNNTGPETNVYWDSPTFTEPVVSVSASGTSDVTTTSMTLNGSLDYLNAESADVQFEYRQSGATTWNTTPIQTLTATGSFSESLTGLSSGTDYEYRAFGQASSGETSTSVTKVQQTKYDAPAVSTSGVDFDADGTTATLNGEVDRFGDSTEGDVSFEWGPTGSVTTNQTTPVTVTSTGPYSDSISGLTEGNDYDYRARIDTPDGDTEVGATKTFTASSVTVIDDFEDTDWSEWSSTAGGPAQVTTSDAPSGNAVMEYRQGGNDMTYSTAGLPAYPAQGDTFKYWFYVNEESNGEAGVLFGLQDTSNFYGVGIDLAAGEMTLNVWSAGSQTTLNSAAYAFGFQTWYSLEVVWNGDGTITATAYDKAGTQVASTSATDTSYTSGGVGVRANDYVGSWTGVYVDHFRII